MADRYELDASFNKLVAESKSIQEDLARLAAQQRAQGDETRAAALEYMADLAASSKALPKAPMSTTSSTDIEKANAARRQAVDLDKADLDLVAQQNRSLAEQAAIRERIQRSGGSFTIPPSSGGRPFEQTLRGQLAAEQAAQQKAAVASLGGGINQAQLNALRRASLIVPQQTRLSDPSQLAGGRSAADARAAADAAALEAQERERILAAEERSAALEAERLASERALTAQIIQQRQALAYQTGYQTGSTGGIVHRDTHKALAATPQGMPESGAWTAADIATTKYNTTLGTYDGQLARAGQSTQVMTSELTRLGVADAEASDQMRKHGALTTEFLGALARGETTVSEFGYQIGATIGKFAGWTAAAAATYGALGAVAEFGKGAIDAASSVQQLTRTIDNLDPNKASQAIQAVSRETNVSMKEAGDAVFAFSRTFHTIEDASGAARLGLGALKLDNVALTDSVRASTAISQQFGGGLNGLRSVYDELSSSQREYNARISDMIPLLQKSSGAVHNAGGDLTQLIQIGAYAARITQQGGSQIGTGIYRSASNILSPATSQGQGNRASLRTLGIDVNESYTQTLINAIKRSQETGPNALTPTQRGQLSIDIFGKQYGGRFSSLFNPSGTDVFNQITGQGRGGINPAATKNSFQTELDRELATAGQQLKGFVYGIQRLGAAFAQTGAINVFVAGVHVATLGLNELGTVLNTFGSLPGPLKEAAVAAVALRTAMLFFSRTRLGSSAPGITRIPGFQPSEATQNRASLAIGTRQAIGASEQALAQTQASSVALATTRDRLARQVDGLDKEFNAAEQAGNASQQELAQIMDARITTANKVNALGKEIEANEIEANAQAEQLVALRAQRVGLGATRFSQRRWSDDQVNSFAAGVRGGAPEPKQSDVVRRVNDATNADTGALEANAAAARADAAALNASSESEGSRASRIASGAATMVSAIDPWLVAMIALPFAISEVTSAIKEQDQAEQTIRNTLRARPATISDLARRGAELRRAAGPSTASNSVANALGFGAIEGLFGRGEAGTARVDGRTINPNDLGRQIKTITQIENDMVKHFTEATKGLGNTTGGRDQISQIGARMKAYIEQAAKKIVPNLPSIQRDANRTFAEALQNAYNRQIQNAPVLDKSPFASFSSQSPKQLQQTVQFADDYSKVFGAQGNSLKRAAYAYTFLANKFSHGASDADLQNVATAQQNFVSTVTKSVQDMLHSAQGSTTLGGQTGDINAALGVIEHARQVEQQALAAIIKEDRGNANAIRKAKEAANQVFAQLNDQLKSVLDAGTALIDTQTQLAQSKVTGQSPEADITRATIAVNGAARHLDALKRAGADWSTVAKQQQVLNDAQNTLSNDLRNNADAVAAATDKLALSRITGISPADDMARAKQGVTDAANQLARDRASGKGQAAILADQAALFDAEHALNQQIQTRSQQEAQDASALLQAQTSLQQSQTLDPIKQAREQLASDIRALALIKPQNYTDPKQYQAALLGARAKINSDKTSLNDQIVQTDLATAQFELNTGKIGDQQYINTLNTILRTKRLTLQEKQQIESEIYRVQQGLSGSLDLNTGNIKLPSVYEIKRAIGLGQRGQLPGGTNMVVNHTSNVTVNVYGPKGATAVGRVLDAHLNTSVSSVMRAKGVV